MEKNKKSLVVPCDFTEVAANALHHAAILSEKLNAKMIAFNVVSKEKDIINAMEQLKDFVSKTGLPKSVEVEYSAKNGNIYDAIKEEAESTGSIFVVMGTHGMSGMQKLIGSKAIKVIANSVVPFIVVQEKPVTNNYFSKIIVPIDFTIENKEKLRWANYLASYFNSEMILYLVNITNEALLKKVKANLSFAKKYFDEREIKYKIQIAPAGKKFADSIIEFSNKVDANGLLIMTTKAPSFTDYLFGADEQQIIANTSKTPVICINPRTDTKKYAGFN